MYFIAGRLSINFGRFGKKAAVGPPQAEQSARKKHGEPTDHGGMRAQNSEKGGGGGVHKLLSHEVREINDRARNDFVI